MDEFLEALASADGRSLRVNLVDTIVFSNSSISAWYYTNAMGEVDKAEEHELLPSAVLTKLQSMQPSPEGILAVAHYQSGRKLLNESELESLVSLWLKEAN